MVSRSNMKHVKGLPSDTLAASRERTDLYKDRSVHNRRKGKGHASDAVVGEDDERVYTPWCDKLDSQVDGSTEIALHYEIVAYTSYALPSTQESEARRLVIEHLSTLVQKRWPDAIVRAFGSSTVNLYLPEGDIDLVVMFPSPLNAQQKKTTLFQLSSMLKNSGVTGQVQVNTHAKVPVITFVTQKHFGEFGVDISIGSDDHDGIKAISIVNGFLDRMPALRPLVLVVKQFLSQKGLNSAASGSLSSYSIVAMCISFLQLNPARRDSNQLEKPLETHSLSTVLLDFLNYYGNNFPYSTSYISVTEGKLLPKEEKGWVMTSQPELLAIECLVNPNKDVSKGAGKIRHIKAAFQEAYLSLRDAKLTYPATSILGHIIKIRQRTVDHRQLIHDIVDSGDLKNRLHAELSWVYRGNPSHRYRRDTQFSLPQKSTPPAHQYDPHQHDPYDHLSTDARNRHRVRRRHGQTEDTYRRRPRPYEDHL